MLRNEDMKRLLATIITLVLVVAGIVTLNRMQWIDCSNYDFKKESKSFQKQIAVKENAPVKIKYDCSFSQGNIQIMVFDSHGDMIDQTPNISSIVHDLAGDDTAKSESTRVNAIGGYLKGKSTGKTVDIVISGEGATGHVKISW